MQRWSDFNGTNSFFPAAVRIGYDPDSILMHLNTYSRHTYPNGFQLDNPHGIENWSTVPNTINEMLCMGCQDIVRIFPVWPREKDALFHQIRVEGAFLVSAELKDQEVISLHIVSEQGRPLHLLNPWKQKKVRMKIQSSNLPQKEKELEGDIFHIESEPGTSYSFMIKK